MAKEKEQPPVDNFEDYIDLHYQSPVKEDTSKHPDKQ